MKKIGKRNHNLKYDKLDNTAQLFPVIAREGMSNVYRVAVLLKEDIDGTALQIALEKVLPYFDVFRCTMKNGVYYTVRTDSSSQYSFIKGYVKDGVLTKVYTHTGFTIAYDTATNELSVTLGSVSSTNTLYFFIFD